jgi:hypothetical protein
MKALEEQRQGIQPFSNQLAAFQMEECPLDREPITFITVRTLGLMPLLIFGMILTSINKRETSGTTNL